MVPFVGAEVNEDYIARYLTLANIPIEQTVFSLHMRRLPAGCLSASNITRRRCGVTGVPATSQTSPWHRRMNTWNASREKLDRAVKVRLRTAEASVHN